ncbi:unnamed protein product [Paramecium pentaurelia]|uniref:Uncharacterized protein n=1 Tax=Paramecium pentaurelia TaxID=43138 RepID=A0A8S1U0T3_9CILI|nr:unnamed protein product [Paramecium pentaurelia]
MILLLYIFIASTHQAQYTLTVKKGDQYETPTYPAHQKNLEVVQIRIKLGLTAATYVVPHNENQMRCMTSWNKLYGYSRCLGSLHHKDSDRFVFRRAQSCLKYNEQGVYEIPNCQEKDLVEIAAYAYDNSVVPYEHPDQLIRIFNTKIRTEVWYQYRLIFLADSTIYELMDDNGDILEKQTIQHRTCYAWKNGYRLNLYFGGVCEAPVDIVADHVDQL